MFIALIVGLIAGFLLSIPIGPVNVSVVNTLIKHNFKSAFAIAAGGAFMDFIFFMIFLSGLSFFQFTETTILILKIVGALFLFGFGLKELFIKKQYFKLETGVEKKAQTWIGYFLLGAALYSSNPTIVASMSGLVAVIRSWNLFPNHFSYYLAVSLGLALGSALWSYLLLKIVSKYQNRIPERFFINFSRICGVLIILISLYMAFNIYKET